MNKTKLVETFNIGGTSWFGLALTAKPSDIINALGAPHYTDESGEDKTSLEWDFETEDGLVFTIYDWKEYDAPAARHLNDRYTFHIGVKDSKYHERVTSILAEYGLRAK
jgi:hypothetical protein